MALTMTTRPTPCSFATFATRSALSLLREARGGGSSFEFNTNPSQRTKAAAEEAFLRENPQSTIIRPSIIFGLGDSFFTVSRGKVSHPSR
jgi:nucleoside-diphosphate-sugar epimerase